MMLDRPSVASVPAPWRPSSGPSRVTEAPAGTLIARLMCGNLALRMAVTLSGQLFGFFAATQLVSRTLSSAMVVSAVGGCFNIAALVTFPLAGGIADRRGHARVLVWSPLIGAFACGVATLIALSHLRGALGLSLLLIARAGEGVGAVCAVPSMFTLLARATERDEAARTRVMGMFEITALVGLSLGILCAGMAWERFRAHALVALVPLYLVGAPLLAIRDIKATATPIARMDSPSSLSQSMRALLDDPIRRAFIVAWIALNAVVGALLQYLPYLLLIGARSHSQRLVGSFSGAAATMVIAGVGALYVGGTSLWSFVGSRVPRTRMLWLSVTGVIGMSLSLAIVNHGGSRLWYIPFGLSVAIQGGMTPASMGLIGDLTAKNDRTRGAAMGLFSLLMGLGQMLGGLMCGPFVAHWRLDGLLLFDALLGVLALAMMPWILRIASPRR